MLHEKLKAYISNIITDNHMIEKHKDEKTNLENVLNNMYLIENALKKTNNKLFRRISQTQLKKIILCILKNDDKSETSYAQITKSKKKLQNKSKQINNGIDIGANIELEGNPEKIEKHGYDQVNNENIEGNKIKTNLVKIKEENNFTNSNLNNIKICIDKNTVNLNTYKGINNIKKDIYYSIVYPYKYRHDNFNTIININGINGSGKTSLVYAIAGECDSHFFYIKLPEYVKYLSNDNKNNKLKILFEQIKNEYNKCILCIDDMDILFNSKDDTIDIYIFTYLLNLFDKTNVVIILLSINKPYDTILYSKIQKFISMPIPTYEDRIEILQNLSQNLEINFDVIYTASITYGFNRAQIYDILNESKNLFIYNHVLYDKTNDTQISSYFMDNKKDSISINISTNEDNNYDQHLKIENDDMPNDTTHYADEEKDSNSLKDNSPKCVNNKIESVMNINSLKGLKNVEEIEKVTNLTKRKERNNSDYVDIYIKEKKQKKIIPININNDIIYESIKNIKKKITTQNICEVPNINLDNIGSLKNIKKILETKFILPVKYSNIYKHLGINKSMGILLYGPPGCGKTMLAKAISNEMKANFIAIKGPEILNKYVGESEKKVREIFSYASTYKPCLIFFDEIDSICINRDNNKTAAASDRVVNQLLTEMDGLSQREGIYIIATTNRPDIIDKALLRTGRFDQLIYVSLPKYQGRIDILKKLSKNMPLNKDIDFKQISILTKGYSGADLHGVLRESAFIALQECRDKIDRFNYKFHGITSFTSPNIEQSCENDGHNQNKKQNCFITTSENTLNCVLNKNDASSFESKNDYSAYILNDNKLDEINPKSLEHYNSENGQTTNNEISNPNITDQNIFDVVQNQIMTIEDDSIKLGKIEMEERQKEEENNKENFIYKIEDLKNEDLQEKDKNNLIYEFIQKNKNILAIKQKHILQAINIVPRSVTKKQMKYYKEISKKFK
ncbi:ATPase, putative [Plasmodium berghei]|uniref:ATPase, putative n=1 Tax=Plasmodium berghei TaxID=5821 RepID=A0A1D3Q680_PLABE|nr:ATPase, putative [Plasmodium berghei]